MIPEAPRVAVESTEQRIASFRRPERAKPHVCCRPDRRLCRVQCRKQHSQSRDSANDDHEHMREAETAPFQSKPKTMQRGDHERHTGRVDCQRQRDKR